ncbi:hypothetical protein V2W45_1249279 [Cenococcum geophilum]
MSVAGRLHAPLSLLLFACLATASNKASNDGNRIAAKLGCSAGTTLLNAQCSTQPF